MRKFAQALTVAAVAIASILLNPRPAAGQLTGSGSVNLTAFDTPFTENFDTLAQSGTTNTALPTGWYISETGSAANGAYAVGSNASVALGGNVYSFGSLLAPSDRALGSIRSSQLVPLIGARFTNNTGGTIASVTIIYTGEQWYRGTAQSADRLVFEYSTTATSIATGTFTPASQLDFTSPNMIGSGVGQDGNALSNQTKLTHTISGLNLAPGGTLTIRWVDNVSGGQDDGLAVDTFSVTASPVPEPATALGLCAVGLGAAGLVRRRVRSAS